MARAENLPSRRRSAVMIVPMVRPAAGWDALVLGSRSGLPLRPVRGRSGCVMPIPQIVGRWNKAGLNRVTRHIAPWLPGFGVVIHAAGAPAAGTRHRSMFSRPAAAATPGHP